jgi:hypothetical protein
LLKNATFHGKVAVLGYNMVMASSKGGVELEALMNIGCFVLLGYFVYLAIAD